MGLSLLSRHDTATESKNRTGIGGVHGIQGPGNAKPEGISWLAWVWHGLADDGTSKDQRDMEGRLLRPTPFGRFLLEEQLINSIGFVKAGEQSVALKESHGVRLVKDRERGKMENISNTY